MPAQDGEPAFKVHVRGYQNTDYVRRQAELMQKLTREFGTIGNAPADRIKQVDLDLLCETVLTGWEGLTDAAGKAIEFSADKAKEILASPDALLLRNQIESAANSVSQRRKAVTEDTIKN
jgi:nitrogen fixation/metabolism regulation signal transduction histidine kinase